MYRIEKKCPYCGEMILDKAIKCKHCKEWLEKVKNEDLIHTNIIDDKIESSYKQLGRTSIDKRLYRCRDCGQGVSLSAKKCPYCGAEHPAISSNIYGIAIFIVLGLGIWLWFQF